MMVGWAQEKEELNDNELDEYYIDSVVYNSTPYKQLIERDVLKDEDKEIDYYNDIIVYEVKSKNIEQNQRTGPRPTIFMLPGGAFLTLVPEEIDQMDPNASLSSTFSMAKKLVASPYNYNVFIIRYVTTNTTPHFNTVFPIEVTGSTSVQLSRNCIHLTNETGRATALEASYKAFRDFRRILKVNFLDSATIKNIDINNIFLVGSSAGAVLALNALFLQQSDIPSQIPYLSTCAGATSNISISPQVRNDFWNLPQFKGVFTMAGAWIYDSLSYLTSNTPTSSMNTAIYMLHGTCDAIINRRSARIGFRFSRLEISPLLPTIPSYNNLNTYPANRYITGNGSEIIFNSFKNSHNKITYGQVYKGGHGVFFPSSSAPAPIGVGAWDLQNSGTNPPNPVFNEVADFVSRLVANPNDWETRAFVLDTTVIPEARATICASFDQFNDTICFRKVYPPTINYTNFICDNNTYIATLGNLYSPATYTWTSSGNIQTVGATNGTSVQYKRISSSGSGSLSVAISRPCATTQTFTFLVYTNLGQGWTLNAGPLGINNQCGVKYASLPTETIPPNSTAIFSINITDAALLGIANMEWEFNCGTIMSGPTHVWSGNNLYSEITVLTGPLGSPCTNVRVRPVSTCGSTGSWRSQNLSLFACSGGMGMMIHPNPGTTRVTVELTNAPDEQKMQTYPLELVDLFGMVMLKTEISDGKVDLDISQFKTGQYKVIIRTSEKPIYSNFNISR